MRTNDCLKFDFLKICKYFSMAKKLNMSEGNDRKLKKYVFYFNRLASKALRKNNQGEREVKGSLRLRYRSSGLY